MHLHTPSRTHLRSLIIVVALSAARAYSQEPVDLSAIHRIKAEALENSKVMEHVFYLTDVNGPRLTNSPGFKSAGDWVVKRLKEYGLADVHEETWGPFGRGWTYTHFAGHMLEPAYAPLIGFPLAWSSGHATARCKRKPSTRRLKPTRISKNSRASCAARSC